MPMKKLLFGALAVLAILVAVAALWWFRPWSDYSPAETIRLATSRDRVDSFRNMEATYPYRRIEGADTIYAFPDGPALTNTAYAWDGERRTLDDYAEDWTITGLMVVANGKKALERYFRGETADSRHTSWSVAKSVTATLIGRALMEGRIDSLDDPVEKYAAEYEDTDYGRTSLRHLLMMSSGIDFEEEYERADGDARRLFLDTFLFNRDIDESLGVLTHNREPGRDHDYISPNSAVLAAVVRGVNGGRPLAEVAQEQLFEPLGMRSGTWLLDRRGGKELGYCCLQVTLEDYAKLGQLYLQGGVVGTQRIVPKDWPTFVSTPPQESHLPADSLDEAPGEMRGYGHHFWLPAARRPTEEGGEYFMAGYNGQIVWIDPGNDVVIAMTSADPDFAQKKPEWIAMFRALADRANARAQAAE